MNNNHQEIASQGVNNQVHQHKARRALPISYALPTYNLKNRLVRLAVVIAMRTTVTKRAQTVVPAEIRVRYGIKGGDLLESIDEERA